MSRLARIERSAMEFLAALLVEAAIATAALAGWSHFSDAGRN